MDWFKLFGTLILSLYALSSLSSETRNDRKENSNVTNISKTSFLNNFSDLHLLDQHKQTFSIDNLVGHTVLVNFIFTSCSAVCPTQTKSLVDIKNKLSQDDQNPVAFLSISIDPKRDTPEHLLHFMKKLGANLPDWTFLTGNPEDIATLTQRFHIFDETNNTSENTPATHRAALWLVDKRGRMVQRYRGDPIDQDRIIKEVTQINNL